MNKMNKQDWIVFKALCKAIRREQDWRMNYNKESVKLSGHVEKPASIFLHVSMKYVWDEICFEDPGKIKGISQTYAILYKFQKDGLVDIHRPTSKYGKAKIQLTSKGVELVNKLKQKVRS